MACEAGRRFLAGLGFLAARQQTRTFCYGDRRERVLALTRTSEWQTLKKWGEGLRIKRTCNGLSKVTKMASMCSRGVLESDPETRRLEAPPSQSVSCDKNAYLPRSRIVG